MTQTTNRLTSIFPVGYDGNSTEVASKEDNDRMAAWKKSLAEAECNVPHPPHYGGTNMTQMTKATYRKDIQEVIELVEYVAKAGNFPSWVEYAKRAREALDEILVAVKEE